MGEFEKFYVSLIFFRKAKKNLLVLREIDSLFLTELMG